MAGAERRLTAQLTAEDADSYVGIENENVMLMLPEEGGEYERTFRGSTIRQGGSDRITRAPGWTPQEMPKSPLGRTVWGLEETSNDRRAAAGARRRVKLPRNEYRRRVQQGCCTYCGGGDHARTACALGRLMRRVPKQELARRVRDGVCPLCGDWARDGHTKKECSLKKELEGKLGRWTDKGHGDGNNEDDDWNDWVTRPRDAAQETEKASAARVWEWMLRCGGQPAGAPGEETYDADWEAEWEMPETPATPTTNLVELSQGSKETDKAVVVEIVELDEDLLIDLRD